jgi:hypothetical protein
VCVDVVGAAVARWWVCRDSGRRVSGTRWQRVPDESTTSSTAPGSVAAQVVGGRRVLRAGGAGDGRPPRPTGGTGRSEGLDHWDERRSHDRVAQTGAARRRASATWWSPCHRALSTHQGPARVGPPAGAAAAPADGGTRGTEWLPRPRRRALLPPLTCASSVVGTGVDPVTSRFSGARRGLTTHRCQPRPIDEVPGQRQEILLPAVTETDTDSHRFSIR